MAVTKHVDTAAVLAALAEPRRADIVKMLERSYCSQRDLCDALGMSQPLISHHLKVLRDAGLVTSTVCDRVTVYILRPSTLRALVQRLELMTQHAIEIAKIKRC